MKERKKGERKRKKGRLGGEVGRYRGNVPGVQKPPSEVAATAKEEGAPSSGTARVEGREMVAEREGGGRKMR